MRIRKPYLFCLSAAMVVQAGAITYPADLLNLTNWKLQLPIGQQGSVTEVKQPALDTFTDEYCHLNTAQDGIVFKAHCGGVTTSGSSYPRSELREMVDNGKTNAAWSTSSGVHTMYLKEAVMHLPDVKDEVVAGQIHGTSSDLVEVRLEGARLFLQYDGIDGATLSADCQLGTVFTVRIVASNGHVLTYYNDATTPAEDYPAQDAGCYFKAGCYTQSNVSKGDSAGAYGEVCIYDLRVTHELGTSVQKSGPIQSLSMPSNGVRSNGNGRFTVQGRLVDRSRGTVSGAAVEGLHAPLLIDDPAHPHRRP